MPTAEYRGTVNDEERPYSTADSNPALKRVRTRHFRRAKEQGIKITGLTSYDYLSASIFDDAGIDFLLVGDSAGNTVFGYDTTLPVTVDELLGAIRALLDQCGLDFEQQCLDFHATKRVVRTASAVQVKKWNELM